MCRALLVTVILVDLNIEVKWQMQNNFYIHDVYNISRMSHQNADGVWHCLSDVYQRPLMGLLLVGVDGAENYVANEWLVVEVTAQGKVKSNQVEH